MISTDRNESTFDSSEFPLCAALVTLGFPIDAIDKRDPSRVVFCFPMSDPLMEAVKNYWEGNLIVDPKEFWSVQRELKSRIRDRY